MQNVSNAWGFTGLQEQERLCNSFTKFEEPIPLVPIRKKYEDCFNPDLSSILRERAKIQEVLPNNFGRLKSREEYEKELAKSLKTCDRYLRPVASCPGITSRLGEASRPRVLQ